LFLSPALLLYGKVRKQESMGEAALEAVSASSSHVS
jgi:hypothetical protein